MNPRRFARRLAVAALVALTGLSGCGYALAGRGSFLPAHIKKVCIPQLGNRTEYTGAEPIFTQKIREEFIGRRGRSMEVTSDCEGSHARLTGDIVAISQAPAGFTNQQLASRYRFTVTIKAAFIDAMDDKVLWSNDALTFSEEYDISPQGPIQGGTFVTQYRSSFERLAADAARTVVTAITEAF
jgi:outer membrane lipopolysaccharide assembly protein LptE/RlpB